MQILDLSKLSKLVLNILFSSFLVYVGDEDDPSLYG